MSERWGQVDADAKLRERIAVLETSLSAMQAAIKTLTDGQAANRAYSEKSFNEVKVELAEMKTELSDLKAIVAANTPPTDGQKNTQRLVLGIGILFAVLIVILLLLWLRLGSMGIHL